MLLNRERAIEIMDEHNLDALIASSPENNTYAGDFPELHGCMSDIIVHVVLPREKDVRPVVIISKLAVDIFLASNSWIEDVELWGDCFVFEAEKMNLNASTPLEKRFAHVIRNWKAEPGVIEALAKALEDRGLIDARLGIDEKNFSPSEYEKVKSSLRRAKIVPANHIFRKIRMVKTDESIKKLREAAVINEKGLLALIGALEAGKTEKEVAWIHDETVRREGGIPYHGCVQGGTRGALPNGEPTEYVLKNGEGIRLDFDCTYAGHYADMARTAVIGKPSNKLKAYYEAVAAGIKKAEEVMRPGVTAAEVFRATVNAVKQNGIPHFDRHHVGHGIGLECYDLPLLGPNNHMQLEEGTVLNIETPYYEIGFGAVHPENTYLITRTGCECLQKSGLELKIA